MRLIKEMINPEITSIIKSIEKIGKFSYKLNTSGNELVELNKEILLGILNTPLGLYSVLKNDCITKKTKFRIELEKFKHWEPKWK